MADEHRIAADKKQDGGATRTRESCVRVAGTLGSLVRRGVRVCDANRFPAEPAQPRVMVESALQACKRRSSSCVRMRSRSLCRCTIRRRNPGTRTGRSRRLSTSRPPSRSFERSNQVRRHAASWSPTIARSRTSRNRTRRRRNSGTRKPHSSSRLSSSPSTPLGPSGRASKSCQRPTPITRPRQKNVSWYDTPYQFD